MTDDNSNNELVDMDNLDNFSNTFYGKDEPAPAASETPDEAEDEAEEEANENGDDTPATDVDEDANPEEVPDDDAAPEDEEETPKPKSRKSAKDRIEELYANTKRLERELAALKATPAKAPTEEVPINTDVAAEDKAPKPDAVDKDGELIYPLGEFDRNYIRDLTRFTITQENAKAKEEAAKEAEAHRVAALQEELTNSWAEKVTEAEKEIPDIREHLTDLEQTFEGINPLYGEYLAATIMSCDNGPQIMYYFSQNIGEAKKIVASGHAAAALAIGRLDAKLSKPEAESTTKKKVSNAPKPAEARNRGSGTQSSVPHDTDNLDAFSREFYGKK